MKIRTIKEIEKTDRDVRFTGGNSLRLLLEKDRMGFAFCKTMVNKGGPYHWHYPNHLESCFCISGKGILTNLSTGEKYPIEVDTIYILDQHDNHTFEALEDTVLISVFNPPLTGQESHREDGTYEALSSTNKFKAWEIVKAVNAIDNVYDAAEYVEQYLNGQTQ
jgi:L-ectoine synthase